MTATTWKAFGASVVGRGMPEPLQQILGTAAAAVGVLCAEGGHALGAEPAGGIGRGVALDVGQRTRRHVGRYIFTAHEPLTDVTARSWHIEFDQFMMRRQVRRVKTMPWSLQHHELRPLP